MQIALTLERRSRAFFYAAVSTVASVAGGVLGWVIGYAFWHGLSDFFFKYVPGVTPDNFELVRSKFEANAFLAMFTAALTPIPYKVFTIAGGVFEISLLTLIVGSIIGRGMRFFAVAAIFWFIGPPAKHFIEKYFNLLTIVFTVLLIAGFVLIARAGGKPKEEPPAPKAVEPAAGAIPSGS